jgi:hypothetical protein
VVIDFDSGPLAGRLRAVEDIVIAPPPGETTGME